MKEYSQITESLLPVPLDHIFEGIDSLVYNNLNFMSKISVSRLPEGCLIITDDKF